MAELNNNKQNPMPEVKSLWARKALSWLSWALVVAGPIMALYVALMSESKTKANLYLTATVLAGVGGALQVGLRRNMRTTALVLALIFLGSTGCYKAAWAAMDGTLEIKNAIAEKLAEKGKLAHDKCITFGTKTQAYAACIKLMHKALVGWIGYGRSGITSGVRVTKVSVEIAEEKKKKLDWQKVLSQIGCALSGVGSDWVHHVTEELKALRLIVTGLDVATCTKNTKSLSVGVGDILGPVGSLIGWLVKALGEPVEVIRKRVRETLRKPLTDATDPVLATISASLPSQ